MFHALLNKLCPMCGVAVRACLCVLLRCVHVSASVTRYTLKRVITVRCLSTLSSRRVPLSTPPEET